MPVSSSTTRMLGGGSVSRHAEISGRVCGGREEHRECGAGAVAVDEDHAAVRLDGAMHHGEAEPAAPGLRRGEGLKESVGDVRGNALALIANLE
jgi:hypothetical protein